ncbi:Uncharacterised protein [uncultured archaeon]|nr:Uncharacterised protein [uncultured archaeon]
MTTIIIKKENCPVDDKILLDMGYVLKRRVWFKKIEISGIGKELERLQVLKIPDIEVVLD